MCLLHLVRFRHLFQPLPSRRSQVHVQGHSIPQSICILSLLPALAIVCELEIKVEEDASKDDAHFGVGETFSSLLVQRALFHHKIIIAILEGRIELDEKKMETGLKSLMGVCMEWEVELTCDLCSS
jgi:hypothetical protein